MKYETLHPADVICAVMKRIYEAQMTTVSGGNLSIRDGGDMWVTPSGTDKLALRREDIVKIGPDGRLEGRHKASVETPIHEGIYKVRPEMKAVLHVHSPALITMSIMRRLPSIALLAGVSEYAPSIRLAEYALPGSEALIKNVCEAFGGGNNVVVLENHGVFIGSEISLQHAFLVMEILENSARTELLTPVVSGSRALGVPVELILRRKQALDSAPEEFEHTANVSAELLMRGEICEYCHRAYRERLFTGTQGVISARLGRGAMLITPRGTDLACLEPQDIVLVKDGRNERGKAPSEYARLHERIYEREGGVNAIIMAAPPYAMTFAVSKKDYDVKLIPECYNRLKASKRFAFPAPFGAIADYISLKTPVAFLENEAVLIGSSSIFAAFDRLNILELSAVSVFYSKAFGGDVINISPEQLKALESKFSK